MGAAESSPMEEPMLNDDVENSQNLTPEEEIKRVLKYQNNYYKVLKGVVTSAHSTLSNAALRAAYDMYASQVEVDQASSDSFSEWESKGGANMAHLPPWLVKGLNHPILGPILMFFIILLMLVFFIVFLIIFIVWFIIHMILWVICCFGCCGHCWPRYGEGARLHAKRQERFMQMLQDYEIEANMARAQGRPMPDPNIFFANWQAAHPERFDDDIPTAGGAYGSTNYR